MKYRNVLAATAMLGMLAVTGCSRGALPENNEANYNGERLVRSVSRHTHEMENRVENAAERTTRGFTRGINRNRQARQDRHTGIRTNERTNRAHTNRHERNNPINRNTRGLNRAEGNRNHVAEGNYEANRMHNHYNTTERNHNRVSDRAHRANTPEYALNYDANYEQSVPVSLSNEGTANFFKKSGEPKTVKPEMNPVPATTTPQPAQ